MNAPLDLVDKYIERILSDGEFRAPDPMMNLDMARQRATLALLRAECDDTPVERVELLRRWIVQIDELQFDASKLPPQMQTGAEGAPPAEGELPPGQPQLIPPGALPPGM